MGAFYGFPMFQRCSVSVLEGFLSIFVLTFKGFFVMVFVKGL